MVAAIPAIASPTTTAFAASTALGSKNPSLPDDPHNPSRPPLIPFEKDNAAAAVSRRPRTKEISSRYLSSYSFASSTTSTSYSSFNSCWAHDPLIQSISAKESATPFSTRILAFSSLYGGRLYSFFGQNSFFSL